MNPLMNLILLNSKRTVFRYQKDNDEETTILLYAPIVSDDYYGGVSPTAIATALSEIDTPTTHLRINSPGGDVFAGRAIEQLFREYDGKLIVHIDGYAASAASYVALAADERIVSPGGFFMIHKGWTISAGNADDFTKTADLLNKIDGSLVKTYVDSLKGVEASQVESWMAEETWFGAEESLKYGFATSIAGEGESDSADNSIEWDISCYQHEPGSHSGANGGDHMQPPRNAVRMPSASSVGEEEFENMRRRARFMSVLHQY